jgi:inner membrane protein
MNAAAHQLTAGAAVGMFLVHREQKDGQATADPLVSGLTAALLTKLPDLIEPATSPNHRQFFHSLTFAACVGIGVHELHKWKPEDDLGKFLRWLGMVAGSAYLIHLAMDFTTARSLPVFGTF